MSKLILLSDIHLENKSPEAALFVLKSINEKIALEKGLGNEPIVVLAGDIHNGTKAYDWMSRIKAPIIYVAGNHEFWGGDFYEINEDLQKKSPSNVSYLYNKALVVGDTIFLGSTLWTDVAEKTNPDLSHHCTFVMNDSFRTTAKKWYETPANIEKLNELTSRADEFISEQRWNILVEREENEKTQRFYNAFNAIHYFFKEYLNNEKSHLKYSVESTYSPLPQEVYEQKMANLISFKNDISFKDYMALNDNFSRPYGNDYLPSELLKDNEFLDEFFRQFKHENFTSKKIVVVSHHLPFMEEILVGHHRNMTNRNGTTLPNALNEVNDKIFLINEGQNYPFHNYFWQCSKGEIPKDQDITKIAHYCNSGSKMFHNSFLRTVDVWLHGHEHHYNFIDYLKGIKIATNPMGYALHGLTFEQGVPVMDKVHVGDKDKEQAWDVYIAKTKKEFIQEVLVEKNTKENYTSLYHQQAEIWSWYLWNKETYLEEINDTLYLNKKLSSIISKKIQGQKYDQFQIQTYAVALNSLVDSLSKKEAELSKAITVRTNVDFSYQSSAYGLILRDKNLNLSLDLKSSREFNKLNTYLLKEEFDFNPFGRAPTINQYGLKELFYNSVQLAYAQKRVTDISELLKDVVLTSPQDIGLELIEKFNSLQDDMSMDKGWKLGEKIEKRFYNLIDKLKKKAPVLEASEEIKKKTLDF
jgi:predicted phosphohydrolase